MGTQSHTMAKVLLPLLLPLLLAHAAPIPQGTPNASYWDKVAAKPAPAEVNATQITQKQQPGGAFDYSKFIGGKGAGKTGGMDFSKFMKPPAGKTGGMDFSKFMKPPAGPGASSKSPGAFDYSKFMGGKSTGGAAPASSQPQASFSSNDAYLKSIGMGK